jgi:hypothetical protein
MAKRMNNPLTSIILVGSILCSPLAGADEVVATKADTTPARLLGGDLSDHLTGLQSKLAINAKEIEVGPFGLYQKPGTKRAPLLLPRAKTPKTEIVEIPFSTKIDALQVAAVMPAEKMFMVGPRALRVGQVIPLEVDNKTIKIRIESVGNSEIVFRNMEDNELAVKRLDLLPDGVLEGGDTITPDGVTRTGDGVEAPLRVELLLPPTTPKN